ncbi:MAG: hypothetical protein ACRCZI_03925 [Cetobacterium sp.]
MNTNIADFLSKLNINLDHSINTFQSIPKNGVGDLEDMYDTIQNTVKKLYTYLSLMKQLETVYFSNLSITNDQFILSFEEESGLTTNSVIWDKYKNSLKTQINIHKLREINKKKAMESIQSVDISMLGACDITPNKIRIPVIKNLKNMQPMFYWYHGDKVYKRGIYTCISSGFYIKVPFPSTVIKDDENYKINSVPCKYETREMCNAHKKKISEIYNSEMRICQFVHRKEKFVKLGIPSKCSKESFGNHDSLVNDLNETTLSDIKRLLMYSLSDTLLGTVWFQNQSDKKELLLQNIEYY